MPVIKPDKNGPIAYFVVDVESDGDYVGDYSMVSFGAVVLEPSLDRRFKGLVAPLTPNFNAESLAACHTTRSQHEAYPPPQETMPEFVDFVRSSTQGRAVLLSDNPAFDWQWINYYTRKFTGDNPFGFTARRIGDFCAGLEKDFLKTSAWKSERGAQLPHDPLEDAVLNAKALLATAKIHNVNLFAQKTPNNQFKI